MQLLLSDGMTYSIVARAAIGTGRAEIIISLAVYGPLLSNSCCIVAYFAVVA
jgi:hypothetical protein